MDPITAISLAIGAIKLGIEIYTYIHDHKGTPPEIKVKVAAKIASDTATLEKLEDWRVDLEKKLAEIQTP